MPLAEVSLDDKYAAADGRVYLTGTQALVRLPLMQRRRDRAAGLDTAGFISGYRGSPLGGFDHALWQAERHLQSHHIRFQPGVNEELAATAVWGSQQVGLRPGARYDGVFGLWYAKGPGVERSGDVLRHANSAGTARHGGVLAVAGDDHACRSSTVPHQSEHALASAMIPVLVPATIAEVLEYGLAGWAMSRFSGCWVALKTVAEVLDSAGSVELAAEGLRFALPADVAMPAGGLNIRWPDPPLAQEERLLHHKLDAAIAFARANRLDGVVFGGAAPRLGIVAAGKAYLDLRQALEELGIDAALADRLGLSLYKVGLAWPLEPTGLRAFAEGLDELVVVEEKRALIETQIKDQLYNWPADRRPAIVGKLDEQRQWMLPATAELSPARIAIALGRRLLRRVEHPGIAARFAALERQEAARAAVQPALSRAPHFCSGCPHNRSTLVPEGSIALGGIGCHYMAVWMDRSTETFTQMGGEGASWIGQAPFTETAHVFVNIGDGTYFHSGLLAIRAAIAAGVNITYKLLYNDAVAMTGGQPVDGILTVPMIVRQLQAEGAARIVVVTDQPERYEGGGVLPRGVEALHRDHLDAVQRDLREVQGVSILVYDQTCAAEKRRRRKRGTLADPPRRIVINEAVCEGCGDCQAKSNCLSVVPVETEFGRKRRIDQSSCNKDFSCAEGFCPSFVSVIGGTLRRPQPKTGTGSAGRTLPEPALPALDRPYGILITGIGGTGVVTIGALLGMAAHLEGKSCSVLDQTGLAQKGGAVMTHVRIARQPADIQAVRLAAGGADLLLGCDLVVSAGADALSRIRAGTTRAVLNLQRTITGAFTRDPDHPFPAEALLAAIEAAAGPGRVEGLDATRLATTLLGDSLATNLFLLGFAWQRGLVPVSAEALDRAIALNGAAIAMNRAAFRRGREAAHDLASVARLAAPPPVEATPDLAGAIALRERFLTAYQDAAYARRYRALIDRTAAAEAARTPGRTALTEAVARGYFKLLAYKDEYEVARLFTRTGFLDQVRAQFDGPWRLRFHLAPPGLAPRDPVSGVAGKATFGRWMLTVFRVLAGLRFLRGRWCDPFGHSAERRQERQLIRDYEQTVGLLLDGLTPRSHDLAVEIAAIPQQIRGYGHVKQAAIARARAREAALLATFRSPADPLPMAAE